MFLKIFTKISTKTSFAFAVVCICMLWSWVAIFYGISFFNASVSYSEIHYDTLITLMCLATVIFVFIASTYYGLFHQIGLSGFAKPIRIINHYMEDDYIFNNHKEIEIDNIEALYRAIVYFPRRIFMSTVTSIIFLVISVVIVYLKIYPEQSFLLPLTLPAIFNATFFTTLISGYFTFIVSEYIIGPYKEKIEKILFHNMKNFKTRHLLSFKMKSFFTLLLIFFSMVLLMVIIKSSRQPIIQIAIYIALCVIAIGSIIFLSINTINLSLTRINLSTKELASGGSGLYFPRFSDKELVIFSHHYNKAAVEINEIRSNLEKRVSERTEELKIAYDKINIAYEQIQADLTLAKKIQESILPANYDGIDGIKFEIFYNPMTEVGGNIYDIEELYPGYIRIFFADTIGHGIQAALVTMIIKSEYEKVKFDENPSMLLDVLNNTFIDLYGSINVFFSCIVIDIDIKENTIIHSSAGHTDQIYILNDKVEELSHIGKVIGIIPNTKYKLKKNKINNNDKLLLFSDGLIESYNENCERFGKRKIKNLVEKKKNLNIKEILNSLNSKLTNLAEENNKIFINDDITIIGIELTNKNQ